MKSRAVTYLPIVEFCRFTSDGGIIVYEPSSADRRLTMDADEILPMTKLIGREPTHLSADPAAPPSGGALLRQQNRITHI